MPRIRSIKPEFPHSESMGKVSRDARLCFVELWTICDDSGKARGNSRMLASLLFPYDDDAPGLIDSWLMELEREDCVLRYEIDGTHYIKVTNWLSHQKIDHPSPSKIQEPRENSRILASASEKIPLDRIGEEGIGEEGNISPEAKISSGQVEPEKPIETIGSPWVTVGKLKEWVMPKPLFDQLKAAFPDLNIESEFRKAKAWLAANSGNRKTAKGMPRFLNGWLDKAQNNGRAASNGKQKHLPVELPDAEAIAREILEKERQNESAKTE